VVDIGLRATKIKTTDFPAQPPISAD
jgi:hypothetical protein